MDNEQLIKWMGEKALCEREKSELIGQYNRDRMSFTGHMGEPNNPGDAAWLEAGKQLLERIHTAKARIDALTIRINELRRFTGN